ncbi:MAG: glycosyltransferase family 2 protein [Candidatus Kariarchaeaceae archaeon]|jgi:glycosyltransferase involved in cell wall biosynthesis
MDYMIDENKIAILIPALNEELNIKKTLSEIPTKNANIIVIDNGSTDQTKTIAEECGAMVISEPRKGYGFACLSGINFLQDIKNPPDLVVFLDADGADDPHNILKLLKIKLSYPHPTLVMGSRLNNLQQSAMSTHAIIANKFLTKLINLLYRVNLKDMGPLRVIDYDALININMRDTGYGWASEMIVKTLKKGYTIREVDVDYRRRKGDSKISGSFLISFKAAISLTLHIFRNAFSR